MFTAEGDLHACGGAAVRQQHNALNRIPHRLSLQLEITGHIGGAGIQRLRGGRFVAVGFDAHDERLGDIP